MFAAFILVLAVPSDAWLPANEFDPKYCHNHTGWLQSVASHQRAADQYARGETHAELVRDLARFVDKAAAHLDEERAWTRFLIVRSAFRPDYAKYRPAPITGR